MSDVEQAREWAQRNFPNLSNESIRSISPRSWDHNCVAWAAGDTERWWWPDPDGEAYWPAGCPRNDRVIAFAAAFATLGYEACPTGSLEDGFEKIAIYTADSGAVKHVVRQLSSGLWTSKCGRMWDFEHDDVRAFEGPSYGRATHFMKRGRA